MSDLANTEHRPGNPRRVLRFQSQLSEFPLDRQVHTEGLLIEERPGAGRALGIHGEIDDRSVHRIQNQQLGVFPSHFDDRTGIGSR